MERFAININKTTKARLYNICRLCGIDSPNKVSILDETLILSDEDDFVEEPLSKKILCCVGIQVTSNDKMPKTICGLCFDKINDFFEFREMCTSTETQTRKLLGLKEIPKIDVKFKKTEIIIPNLIAPNSIKLPVQDNFDKKRGRKRKNNCTELLQNKAIKTEANYEDIEYGLDDKNLVVALTSSKNTNSNKKLPSSSRTSGFSTTDKIKMERLPLKTEMKIPKTFSCIICNINFLSGALLQSHLLKSHVPQVVRYHCVMCNESINNTIEIKNHNLWHKLTKTPYKCGLCSFEIYSLNSYSRHIRECNKFVYIQQKVLPNIQCNQCQLDFQTKNLFYYHNCITILLKCPKCNCKLSNQNTTLKHIATCSVIPKNEHNLSKILIKTEPLHKIEKEIIGAQRSSVIPLSKTDQPVITMLYGLKEVIIRPCTVVIPYDMNLAARRQLASNDMNSRKLKAKSNKRETAEVIKRCDELIKNTMQTLVNIKQEPADSPRISINPILEPMVRIKQEVLNENYGDCDIQVKQEIEELNVQNSQPILKLKIKNESGTLNSLIIETKSSNKKDKKNKKSKPDSNKSLKKVLNGRVAKLLPLPIRIKTEVINPDYNYCETNNEILSENITEKSKSKISNSNIKIKKHKLVLNKLLTSDGDSCSAKNVRNIETGDNIEIGQTETQENMEKSPLNELSSENGAESLQTKENVESISTIEKNIDLNGQNDDTECIRENIKISSVSAGVSASNLIKQLPLESEFNVLNIKKEKEDPGYNRFNATEIGTNIERQDTANINYNNFNDNLMSSIAADINYDHLPADFDFNAVHIKQEIEINEEKFNDDVESDGEDSDTSSEGESYSNEKELSEKSDVINSQVEVNSETNIMLNEGNIKDNDVSCNQDFESSIESSELKILKEKPFIEMKPYENINSWDHCNNCNEYMPELSSEDEINSQQNHILESYDDFTSTQTDINNSNPEFNQNAGSLVISEITSGNAINISNFTHIIVSNHNNQNNENLTPANNSTFTSAETQLKDNLDVEKSVNARSALLLETPVLPSSSLNIENSLNRLTNINPNSHDCSLDNLIETDLSLPIKATECQLTNEEAVVSSKLYKDNVDSLIESNEKENSSDDKKKSTKVYSVLDNVESTKKLSKDNVDSVIESNEKENSSDDKKKSSQVSVLDNVESTEMLSKDNVDSVIESNEKENSDDYKNKSCESSVLDNIESTKMFSEDNVDSVIQSNEKENSDDYKNKSSEVSVLDNVESTKMLSEDNVDSVIESNEKENSDEYKNKSFKVSVLDNVESTKMLSEDNVDSVIESNDKENSDDYKNKSSKVSVLDNVESTKMLSEDNVDSVIESSDKNKSNDEENVESTKMLSEESLPSNEIENQPSTSYMANMTNINEIAENHNNENIEKCLLTQSDDTG